MNAPLKSNPGSAPGMMQRHAKLVSGMPVTREDPSSCETVVLKVHFCESSLFREIYSFSKVKMPNYQILVKARNLIACFQYIYISL